MADKVLTQKSQLGQTFLNAMWIAGCLALVQVSAVGYAIYKRSGEMVSKPAPTEPSGTEIRTPISIAARDTNLESSPDLDAGASFNPGETLAATTTKFPSDPDAIRGTEATENLSNTPDPKLAHLNRKAPDLTIIRDEVGAIEDYLYRELMTNGRVYRSKRDFAKALNDFRDVESNLPNHPLVLSELAATYGEMGELEKASEYWTRVTALGPIEGGEFYQIASKVLNGKNPMSPNFAPGQVLKLGKIRERRLGKTAQGEKVVITIPVFGDSDAGAIDIKKMNWNALCYDKINNQTIGTTFANVKDQYPTGPYDWTEDGLEELEVIYHMPTMSVEDRQFQGEREYFGYAIKLYYEGMLQDSVVYPDEIKKLVFTRNVPAAPSSPQPQRNSPAPGPDNALFPRK